MATPAGRAHILVAMRLTRRHVAALAGIGSLAVAAILWLAWDDGSERPRPGAPRTIVAEPQRGPRGPGPEVPRHPVYGLRAGDVARYRYSERQQVDAMPEPEGPATYDIETAHEGTLVVRGYALDAHGLVAGFSLLGARDLTAELAREVVVRLGPDGRVGPIAVDPAVGVEARRVWRSLLSRWQVVRPDRSAFWTTREEDPTGLFAAEYRADGPRIDKRKIRYEALHGESSALVQGAKLDGGAEILIEGMLRGVRGEEALELHPPGEPLLLRSREEFALELESLDRSPVSQAEAAERMLRLSGEGLTSIGGTDPAPREVEPIDLWAELSALEAATAPGSPDEAAELRAMVRLVELVRREPSAAAALARRLDDRPDDEALAADLLGVLGAAGTEAAQMALLDQIAEPRRSADRRLTAITAVAQLMEPTSALEEGLRALSAEQSDLGSSAQLLLGAVAGRVRESDPARHERILAELGAAASDVDREVGERRTAFSALANAAPAKVPAAVEAALSSDDEFLREAGAGVLARVGAPAAEARLLSLLESDASPVVRVAAAEALGSRPRPATRATLLAAAGADPSEDVRLACLAALGSGPVGADERGRLEWIAREDASEAVRGAAGRMVRVK